MTLLMTRFACGPGNKSLPLAMEGFCSHKSRTKKRTLKPHSIYLTTLYWSLMTSFLAYLEKIIHIDIDGPQSGEFQLPMSLVSLSNLQQLRVTSGGHSALLSTSPSEQHESMFTAMTLIHWFILRSPLVWGMDCSIIVILHHTLVLATEMAWKTVFRGFSR